MLPLLDGVRVLDLCRLIPGDLATAKLADLGAEVIKVEEPPFGDYLRGLGPDLGGGGLTYLTLNRNKRSLGLNLKSEEGKRIFFELLDTADVVVEVSKPGTFQKLGLDYESVSRAKPDIVYCSVTGYGQTGPYRKFPSHGMNIDAAAGKIRIERGPTGRPEMKGISAIGVEMGGLHAALAIAAALVQRGRTGKGQYIDASCWDGAVSANSDFASLLNLPDQPIRDGSEDGDLGARYNVYGTKDDKVILLCPIERKFWLNFCTAVGREDWNDRGLWEGPMDFGDSDPTLRDDIEEVMRTRTQAEWIDLLLAADVPASPVLGIADLEDNEHMRDRHMVVTSSDSRYPNLKFVRLPIRVPEREYEIVLPPPVLGEHTDAILGELGYDEADRARLSGAGVVVQAPR